VPRTREGTGLRAGFAGERFTHIVSPAKGTGTAAEQVLLCQHLADEAVPFRGVRLGVRNDPKPGGDVALGRRSFGSVGRGMAETTDVALRDSLGAGPVRLASMDLQRGGYRQQVTG